MLNTPLIPFEGFFSPHHLESTYLPLPYGVPPAEFLLSAPRTHAEATNLFFITRIPKRKKKSANFVI
jgi:hypothetical protein